ncbi:hypothetical protein [Alicyclobacillus acidiphilus]|uniref:hypothetical protein n=1 Tax=Alicyclobacillus acidiphilus TaxID=182455 RepID=UPI0008340C85|nr:hypothetical protein [Alicyclobacillus acidiphilus]
MLTITTEARRELIRFAKEELYEGEFIRIARAYQCGGPRFQLTVDDVRTQMDVAISLDGEVLEADRGLDHDVAIVIDKTCLGLLANARIDYVQSGFVFEESVGAVC